MCMFTGEQRKMGGHQDTGVKGEEGSCTSEKEVEEEKERSSSQAWKDKVD